MNVTKDVLAFKIDVINYKKTVMNVEGDNFKEKL
jgi:hypothetical protein